MLFVKGDATVKNTSGDTVIGKLILITVSHVWNLSLSDNSVLRLSLLWQMARIVS